MKAVIHCDEVFDVLTRGPFPAGNANDQQVDDHLVACHDCRELAEALRPAIGLFHESMPDDETELPMYRGALEEAIFCDSRSMDPILTLPARATLSRNYATNGMIALGTTILLGFVLFYADAVVVQPSRLTSQSGRLHRNGSDARMERQASSSASDAHAETSFQPALAALGIPLSCLPGRAVRVHFEKLQTAELSLPSALRDDFVCCTRCHFSGRNSIRSPQAMQTVMTACAACHHVSTIGPNALSSRFLRFNWRVTC